MIAQAGGLSYKFDPLFKPVAPPAEPAPAEGTPFNVPAPDDEKIANVEGLTSDYYNAYSKLKSFATNMWQDYGVDVTKPDLTQPGGGQLHQAWLNMEANLRMVSQDLVQQRKWQEEAMTKQMAGEGTLTAGFNPTKQLFSESDQAGFTSNKLMPDVTKALDYANTIFSEPGNARTGRSRAAAVAEIDRVRKIYEQKINDDPYNAQYWQQQVDALRNPVWEPKQFAPRDGGGKDKDINSTVYKKVVMENKGYVPPEQVQLKVENGKVYAFYPATGENFGSENITETTGEDSGKSVLKQKDVAGRIIRPGETYLRFGPPFDNPKYDLKVSDFTADQSIKPFLQYNPQAGKFEDWIDWAHRNKLWTKDQRVPVGSILDLETQAEGQRNRAAIEARIEQAQKLYDENQKVVDEKLTKASGGERIVIPTANGDLIFKKNSWSSGFEFMNPELYKEITGNSEVKKDYLSASEIKDILEKAGAFENVLSGVSSLDISSSNIVPDVMNQTLTRGTTIGAPIAPPSEKPTKNWGQQ